VIHDSNTDEYAATAAQARALAHPTRVRIWVALGSDHKTISQMAHQMTLNKGSVSHHLAVLVRAGLVAPSRTRTVRGGAEKYYMRTKQRVRVPRERGSDTASNAMLIELVRDLDSAHDLHVHQRAIRLSPAQARALAKHLDDLLHGLPPADDRHPLHGIVTAVYRKR
jgi:DNA-binding transcriptional ArsR family regulator